MSERFDIDPFTPAELEMLRRRDPYHDVFTGEEVERLIATIDAQAKEIEMLRRRHSPGVATKVAALADAVDNDFVDEARALIADLRMTDPDNPDAFFYEQLLPPEGYIPSAAPEVVSASIVRSLLDSVTPRCFNCARAATRYLGSPFNGAPARQYACDEHATAEGKWSDLSNAGAIREATKL